MNRVVTVNLPHADIRQAFFSPGFYADSSPSLHLIITAYHSGQFPKEVIEMKKGHSRDSLRLYVQGRFTYFSIIG